MIATSPLAVSQYSSASGTSGTVTVPAGCWVVYYSCESSAGGTLTITPKGPNQSGTAQDPITIPAGGTLTRDWPFGGPLGPATVLVFASTDAYVVEYAKAGAGGMVP